MYFILFLDFVFKCFGGGGVLNGFILRQSVFSYFPLNAPCVVLLKTQPGLINIRTPVHFLCGTVLRILLHVSPQF